MKTNIKDLRWHRIKVIFKNKQNSTILITVLHAIFEGTYIDAFPDLHEHGKDSAPLVFHPDGIRPKNRLKINELFQVTILLCRHSSNDVRKFCEALETRMSDPKNALFYSFQGFASCEERRIDDLINEFSGISDSGELCLEFILPYNGKKMKGKDAAHLEKSTFIEDFESRFEKLFGKKIKYLSENDNFRIIPYYWYYDDVTKRKSRSVPGTQYINGFFGKFYIKGRFQDFLPFLLLGSELHAGLKIPYGFGYYLIHKNPAAYFEPRFPDKKTMISVINDIAEKYDAAEYAAEFDSVNEEIFSAELCAKIKNNEFYFSPNQAFRIVKKSGSERIIEKLCFTDMVIHQYLLKTLSPVLEKTFEEESIGFRKGISRFKAEAMIKEAVADGYVFVIESDVEEFFASVDLNRLKELLDFYLPYADEKLKTLLFKALDSGCILEGQMLNRLKGVAQGSPLSPMMANLYLDDFDEYLKTLDIRLIRYADDFVILAKTIDQAEEVLTKAEIFISNIGLRLKEDKTSIRHISEGFRFLGINFCGSESSSENEAEENEKLFRKPLYITEPSLFLSVNGDALDIVKSGKLVETIPFRRISEVIVLEKSVFSTTLIKKCIDFGISLTTTLNTGYFVTTIKPDSKAFFDTAFLHSKRFNELSETEHLCIAKEFATLKIENYCNLFRKKYAKGDNVIIEKLTRHIDQINIAGNIDEVRGHEGASARIVYEKLNFLIDNKKFHIKKRDRKKPDFINSLLNFGYYLLFSRINATVRCLGMNPYLGFLHSPEDSYESFVCDIEELYRARIDRFIIRIINLKIIQESDFTVSEKGAFLTGNGKHKFLNSFEGELSKEDKNTGLSMKDEIYLQALSFRKWAVNGTSLRFYKREDQSAESR